MIFPSFCIRRGLHELRISCPFCVHKNSVNEIQHEISPTLFIIEPFIIEAQKKTTESSPGRLSNLQI